MTVSARDAELARPYALPPDVRIVPVDELAAEVQSSLAAQAGDVVVARPGYRQRSQLLDGDSAALLEEFREPAPLAEGIVRFAAHRGLDPEAVLRDAFAALQALTAASLLVPADSPQLEGVDASFLPGQLVHGYRIERLVRVLEDTEVYVASVRADTVALKVVRGGIIDPALVLSFGREARILERLDGEVAPRLVGAELRPDRVHLATSWVAGVSASARAAELRRGWSSSWRQQLHTVCARILEAYARLHARGVIHGDVHAPNVLVDGSDRVTLLDFGQARVPGADAVLDHDVRIGAGWHTEPEAADAVRRGGPMPPATATGEQYAVATLIYTMLCGEHPVGPATTRDELLRRIVEQAPLPFTRHGSEPWSRVEAVLARALDKDPARRFEDLAAFHAAFVAASAPPAAALRSGPRSTRLRRAVDGILDVLADPARPPERTIPEPPTASVQFGAAGVALFLTRLGIAEERPEVVAAGDHWARVASAGIDHEDAFHAPALGVGRDRVGPDSLYHRVAGVHLVAALTSHARGDLGGTIEQVAGFAADLEEAGRRGEPPSRAGAAAELAFGRSGLLVGGATLLELLRSTPRLDDQVLVEPLRIAADKALLALTPGVGAFRRRHLGVAHGLAGELYAQLWVRRLLELPVPDAVVGSLEQLAACAQPDGRGVSWPGTLTSVEGEGSTPDHAPGWCAGTAGHVHLWCVAHDALGEPRYLQLAEAAGQHCWEHVDRIGHLCCGTAGRGYALLRLYQQTGDERWRERAADLADAALRWAANDLTRGERPFSLYRGALGPVLLAVESGTPELASMPAFASEHWGASHEGAA